LVTARRRRFPVESQRSGSALPAECDRQHRGDGVGDVRRFATEILEMQRRGDRGGDDGLIRETETGQRPSQR